MSMKHLIKTRTYRERQQPAARQHLGILEKKKDYVLRAKDFHRKEDALQKLGEKALFKNPDEYYYKMARTKIQDGVHQKAAAEQPSADQLRAFKKEDADYLTMKSQAEAKARAARTHSHPVCSHWVPRASCPLRPALTTEFGRPQMLWRRKSSACGPRCTA